VENAVQAYTQIAAKTQRDELILSHVPLVRHVLGRMIGQFPDNVDMENLESAGLLGLVEAANNFDPERGVKFKTYAYTRIHGAIIDELRRNCPLPQHVLERIALLRKAYDSLPAPVSVEALVAATGLSVDEVTDTLAAFRMARTISWDGAEKTIGTRLDERQESPDALAERAEQGHLLAEAITQLPERERLAVTLYYVEDLRLKEIGVLLNLSESRVSRVLDAALFRLGEFMRAKGL
jgi:RNA polymerase sigma factor for flagellar operon FliA